PDGLIGLLRRYRPARAVPSLPGDTSVAPNDADLSAPASVPALAAGTDAILDARGLTCRFGGLIAIDALDLTVRRGTIHALIGPNGSGKSTFVNLASGIYSAASGSIHFDGTRIDGRSPWSIAGRGLVRTFQNLRLFRSLTVLDNVLVGCRAVREAGWIGVI